MDEPTFIAYGCLGFYIRRMASGYHGMGGLGTVPVPLCELSLYTVKRFYTLLCTLT